MSEIEDIVRQKTLELEEKVRELNRSQKAMLYMIEDLNNTSKELKESQERVVRCEKLAALGRLSGIIGHELKNPLGVINNAVYVLRVFLAHFPENEKVKRYLGIIDGQVAYADTIITNILAFGRSKELILSEADINSIIQEGLNKIIIPKSVNVIKDLHEDLPSIAVDKVQLGQCFCNLFINAYQAMPKGGVLSVKSNRKEGFVEVEIGDTGVGIHEENFRKIFEPLFSTKPKGTGLGLSFCHEIIEKHKGIISVKSEVEKGTQFLIRLPIV